jgi:PEP-CTERM motif-containing protein
MNRDPNTGIVSVSIGNPTSDFLFVTDIEIWTGLTEGQANNFDANGDFVTSDLPSLPNFTPADITLSPSQLFGSPILIGNQAIGSYVVALYDLADGPDSNISDAIQYGQFVYSDLVVPEPSSLIILAGGLIGLGAWICLRNSRSNPVPQS